MKKVAFILFGQVKNYNSTQHHQFNSLICPALKQFDLDYYLVTSQLKSYQGNRYTKIEPNNHSIDYLSINNHFNFKDIIYDDITDKTRHESLYQFSEHLINSFRLRAWGKHSLTSTFNSIKQLYSLNYFYNWFQPKAPKYDFFILARSDIFYFLRLILPDLSGQNIFVPNFGHWGPPPRYKGGCNDRFAIITCKDILNLYCTRYNSLVSKPEPFHSEYYLNSRLKSNGVNFKKIDKFRFRLLRSNNIITDSTGINIDEKLTNIFFKK